MRGHFLLFVAGFDNAIDAHFSVTGTPVFALQIHAATGDFGAAQFSSLKQFQAQFHDNQNNANENNEARRSNTIRRQASLATHQSDGSLSLAD
ncbi:MAG: hypothetical protein RKH07_08665 [Gammaproteobacteria bacterium]